MTTKILTGTYSAGYSLSTTYSALYLTNTAYVGGFGIFVDQPTTVHNAGAIVAKAGASPGFEGYFGIYLPGGQITNLSTITGGRGAGGSPSAGGGLGAPAIGLGAGVQVNNRGTMTGGAGGGGGGANAGGRGGEAVYLGGAGSTLVNTGTLAGGAGGGGGLQGSGGAGGDGGAGVYSIAIGTVVLTNRGDITGGQGGLDFVHSIHDGNGGAGVDLMANSRLVNTGTISGGSGPKLAGNGVMLSAGGTITNGDASHPAALISGNIAVLLGGAGTVTNFGTITGVAGVYAGVGGSVTVTNFGTVEGSGGTSVQFKSASDRLIAEMGSTFLGAIKGGGGTLELAGSSGTISGLGAIGTLSGGVSATFTSFGAYVISGGGNWTLAGVYTIGGGNSLTIDNGSSAQVDGGLSNAGTIALVSAGSNTSLEVLSPGATLTGGGTVSLSGSRSRIYGTSGATRLDNVDNTISGSGSLGAGRMTLVNQSGGVVDGDGLVLDTGASTVTNAGLIEATGMGGLLIKNTSIDGSSGGVILAENGSRVALGGADLIGGTLKSAGTGVFRTFAGANELDGMTLAVNNAATVVIANSTTLTVQGAIDNTGKLGLQSGGVGSTLAIGAMGATLTGGGVVQLDNSAKNRIVGASSSATLTNVDNTFDGAGDLGGGELTLLNDAQGVIVGSQSTALIIDTGANTIVNAGQVLAKGKGGVIIESAVDNSGILKAGGGVLTVKGAVNGSGEGVITSGTLDFSGAFSQNVVFSGASGLLELAQSQGYTGAITGFSKTGGTALDLADIGFASPAEATFSGTASGGTLTVTDGTHTAHITLKGDYRGSTFTASSDGHGGTTVVDPSKPPISTHAFIVAMATLGGSAGGLAHASVFAPHSPTMLLAPRTQMA